MRHVITGGPAVGKTTTLEHLARLGYMTVRETARDIIATQQAAGPDGILPWTDNAGFQYLVLEEQLRRERAATGDTVFLDRGVIDAIAYCRLIGDGVPIPPALERAATRERYGLVFLLDPLPGYATDEQRKEDPALATRLHESIGNAYRERGYTVHRIPALAPKERVECLLRLVREDAVRPDRTVLAGGLVKNVA